MEKEEDSVCSGGVGRGTEVVGMGDFKDNLADQDCVICQAFPVDAERTGAVAAVRRGVQDADAGRMIPFEDAVFQLRVKHGL